MTWRRLEMPLRGDQGGGDTQGGGDRRAPRNADRPRCEFGGDPIGVTRRRDGAPRQDDRLEAGVAPFHVGDGDAATRAGLDRLDDIRVAQGGDIAVTLQALFDAVHRVRDVDGEDKLEVDLRCRTGAGGLRSGGAGSAEQGDGERGGQ